MHLSFISYSLQLLQRIIHLVILLLYVCEGKSLTEISAIRDSNVMRIKQILDKSERIMKYRIKNIGNKYISDDLDRTEDNV